MKHIGLFEGIGGFSLAARWMEWETIAWCEWNEYCKKILAQHFPKAKQHGNVKETDFTIYRGQCDIVTGGFPCQPYSQAGKRKGKEDDRHLWPEMLRAIREIQPGYVVGENVSGLTNWNGGMVFDEVQADLENEGYEVLPFLLPACAVNAPHRRDRIWFVAYAKSNDNRKQGGKINGIRDDERRREPKVWVEFTGLSNNEFIANPSNEQLQRRLHTDGPKQTERHVGTFDAPGYERNTWDNFPTQSPLCGRNDGVSFELDFIKRIKNDKTISQKSIAEISKIIWEVMRTMWEQRKLAEASHGIYADNIYNSLPELSCERAYEGWNLGEGHKEDKGLYSLWEAFYSKPFHEAQDLQQRVFECLGKMERRKKMEQAQRVNRIKALGNAIVPQVALQIFKAIEQYENDN